MEKMPDSLRQSATENQSPASIELQRQLAVDPRLRNFITQQDIQAADRTYKVIRNILSVNPQLSSLLGQSYTDDSKYVPLLIIPSYPLILTRTESSLVAVAPVMSCTLDAVADLFNPKALHKAQYHLFTSEHIEGELETFVWNQTQMHLHPILVYKGGQLEATDYVALAARGFLSNEVFRKSFTLKAK